MTYRMLAGGPRIEGLCLNLDHQQAGKRWHVMSPVT